MTLYLAGQKGENFVCLFREPSSSADVSQDRRCVKSPAACVVSD